MQAGKPLDFSDAAVQAQMDESLELVRANEFVVEGTLSSWWEELKGNRTTPLVCFRTPLLFELSFKTVILMV